MILMSMEKLKSMIITGSKMKHLMIFLLMTGVCFGWASPRGDVTVSNGLSISGSEYGNWVKTTDNRIAWTTIPEELKAGKTFEFMKAKDAEEYEVEGNLTVKGNLTVEGEIVEADKATVKTPAHYGNDALLAGLAVLVFLFSTALLIALVGKYDIMKSLLVKFPELLLESITAWKAVWKLLWH